MFTDWGLAEGIRDACNYFYLRGALWGFVVGNLLHLVIIPACKKMFKK